MNYVVTLIATNDAGTASDTAQMNLTLINCFTGTNAIQPLEGLQLIPNPAVDKFCFHFSSKVSDEMEFGLYDPLGTLLLSKNIQAAGQEYCIDITAEKIPSGVYLAVFMMNGERRSMKVVLQ
ncbi:MAG: T9SS type A sorting domain-containing protein [Chitinophagales bacterium]